MAHSGIDASLFTPVAPRGWRGELLYVGRIDRRKGVETAVRCLNVLPEARLTLVGTGDPAYLGALDELADTHGVRERLTLRQAERAELPALYAAADAVLFPVLWQEPWGLVPLEAMAVGRPVIATGQGGSGEYLRATGRTASSTGLPTTTWRWPSAWCGYATSPSSAPASHRGDSRRRRGSARKGDIRVDGRRRAGGGGTSALDRDSTGVSPR